MFFSALGFRKSTFGLIRLCIYSLPTRSMHAIPMQKVCSCDFTQGAPRQERCRVCTASDVKVAVSFSRLEFGIGVALGSNEV